MVVRTGGAVKDVLGGRVIGLLDPVEAGQLALVLWVPVPKQSGIKILSFVSYTAS